MTEEISETTENYLKEIYLLIEKHDYARVSDIASNVHRSLSTVSGAIKRMADEGLLNYERYGKITLTEKGRDYAENVVSNYHLLAEFLQLIGVDKFMDFIKSNPDVQKLMRQFGLS